MKDEFSDSKVCQSCAYCCRTYSWYTEWEDEALRFEYLETDKVAIRKVSKSLWMITLDIPCSKLVLKDGKYLCTEYHGIRPEMCREYPGNVFLEANPDMMAQEMKDCPLVRAGMQRGCRK
jgi:Fe-S-cluster containining protein